MIKLFLGYLWNFVLPELNEFNYQWFYLQTSSLVLGTICFNLYSHDYFFQI